MCFQIFGYMAPENEITKTMVFLTIHELTQDNVRLGEKQVIVNITGSMALIKVVNDNWPESKVMQWALMERQPSDYFKQGSALSLCVFMVMEAYSNHAMR